MVRSDIRTAEIAPAQLPPITDAAASHRRQAVENLLKAYLVCREHEFEKIHDLEVRAEQHALHDHTFNAWHKRVDSSCITSFTLALQRTVVLPGFDIS